MISDLLAFGLTIRRVFVVRVDDIIEKKFEY